MLWWSLRGGIGIMPVSNCAAVYCSHPVGRRLRSRLSIDGVVGR